MRVARVAERQQALIRALLEDVLVDWLELNLTMAQLKALFTLDREPGTTVGGLAERLGVKPPAASLLVDKLVHARLAFRQTHTGDGRRVVLLPTAQGTTLVTRLRQGSHSRLEGWIEQLSDDELDAFGAGIEALARVALKTSFVRESRPALTVVRGRRSSR
jgi:DNA-binding MarR family transcriptional regulator